MNKRLVTLLFMKSGLHSPTATSENTSSKNISTAEHQWTERRHRLHQLVPAIWRSYWGRCGRRERAILALPALHSPASTPHPNSSPRILFHLPRNFRRIPELWDIKGRDSRHIHTSSSLALNHDPVMKSSRLWEILSLCSYCLSQDCL